VKRISNQNSSSKRPNQQRIWGDSNPETSTLCANAQYAAAARAQRPVSGHQNAQGGAGAPLLRLRMFLKYPFILSSSDTLPSGVVAPLGLGLWGEVGVVGSVGLGLWRMSQIV